MITDHLIDSFYQNSERKVQVKSLEAIDFTRTVDRNARCKSIISKRRNF